MVERSGAGLCSCNTSSPVEPRRDLVQVAREHLGVPLPWSKRTSVSATTKRLSGRSGPSAGSGTVGSSFATWS